jgi:hypothetical protein
MERRPGDLKGHPDVVCSSLFISPRMLGLLGSLQSNTNSYAHGREHSNVWRWANFQSRVCTPNATIITQESIVVLTLTHGPAARQP